MDEENNNSLDDKIKEAELEKIKADTVEVQKRIKQLRIMGVPIVQIIFGGIVVGFVLLSYIRPIVTLDGDIATKNSEYNRIKGWIEQVKLDSANTSLILGQTSLIKDRKRLASINIILSEKNEEVAKLQWESMQYQREIDSLVGRRTVLSLSIRELNRVENQLKEMFPEISHAIRVASIPVMGLHNVNLEYILFPYRFSDALIRYKQNSDFYILQKENLTKFYSMRKENISMLKEIIALEDTIISLREQNR